MVRDGGACAALEDIGDYAAAEAAYWRAAALDPADVDAFCAGVFLSQYLCAWKGWKARLALLEQTLAGPVLQRRSWGGACDQPFRLLSYGLPARLVALLTRHVLAKEASHIPAHHILMHPHIQVKRGAQGVRRLTVAYMSSDFGSHTVGVQNSGVQKHARAVTRHPD
jgi:predicted O-linked N-acetylglucosamine transferase (SPINDLY family)